MNKVYEIQKSKNIYQENYNLASELGIVNEYDMEEDRTLKSDQLMDLHIMNVDMPNTNAHHKAVRALLMTHLFDDDGDVIESSEIIMLVDVANKIIEPYSLNNKKASLFDKVCSENIGTLMAQHINVNNFLNNWLTNIKALDYQIN